MELGLRTNLAVFKTFKTLDKMYGFYPSKHTINLHRFDPFYSVFCVCSDLGSSDRGWPRVLFVFFVGDGCHLRVLCGRLTSGIVEELFDASRLACKCVRACPKPIFRKSVVGFEPF